MRVPPLKWEASPPSIANKRLTASFNNLKHVLSVHGSINWRYVFREVVLAFTYTSGVVLNKESYTRPQDWLE